MKYVDAIERLIGQKIDWHDGDLSTVVASEGGDDEPRRGRGNKGGKERGERGGRSAGGEKRGGRGERHAKPRTEAPAAEIAEQPSLVPASVIDARRERKQAIKSDNTTREAKPERAEKKPERTEKKPERAEQPRCEERPRRDRNERPDRTEQNRRQREQDDDGTVGFGDDMPAFMKVDVKV